LHAQTLTLSPLWSAGFTIMSLLMQSLWYTPKLNYIGLESICASVGVSLSSKLDCDGEKRRGILGIWILCWWSMGRVKLRSMWGKRLDLVLLWYLFNPVSFCFVSTIYCYWIENTLWATYKSTQCCKDCSMYIWIMHLFVNFL
jgi:hypothetical protein